MVDVCTHCECLVELGIVKKYRLSCKRISCPTCPMVTVISFHYFSLAALSWITILIIVMTNQSVQSFIISLKDPPTDHTPSQAVTSYSVNLYVNCESLNSKICLSLYRKVTYMN